MGTYTEIGINQVYYGDSDPDMYKHVLTNTASFRQVQKALLEAARRAVEQAKPCQNDTQTAIIKAVEEAQLDFDKDTVREDLELGLPPLDNGKRGPEILTKKGRGHLLKFLLIRIRAIDDSKEPSDRTVRNWITAGQRPGKDEDIFKICFALDLRKREDVEALFTGMNGAGDGGSRPLHRRDAETVAYWECLASGKSWAEAREILDEYEEWENGLREEWAPEPQFEYTETVAGTDTSLDNEMHGTEQILEDLKKSREIFASHSASLRDAYLKQKADYAVPACIFNRGDTDVRKDVKKWVDEHGKELQAAGFGSYYRRPERKEALKHLEIYSKFLNDRFNSNEGFDEKEWEDRLERAGSDFCVAKWADELGRDSDVDNEVIELGWAEVYRIFRQHHHKGSYKYLAFMIKNSTLVKLAFSETREINGVRVGRADVSNRGPRPVSNYDKRLSDPHLTATPFFEGHPLDQYLNQIDGTAGVTRSLRSYQVRKAILLLFFLNYSLEWELCGEPRESGTHGLDDFVEKLNGRTVDGAMTSSGVLSGCGLAPLRSSNQCDHLLMKSIWQYEAGGTRKRFDGYEFRNPKSPDGERIPAAQYLTEDPDELEARLEAATEAMEACNKADDRESLDDYAYNVAALKQMQNDDPVSPSEYFDLVLGDLLLEEDSD